ncbi:MAG: hypothetical protein Crog4KO_01270 [Crocinitomicaceae bacterium]
MRVKIYGELAEYIVEEDRWMLYNRKALELAKKKRKNTQGKKKRFYSIAVAEAESNIGFYYDSHDDKDNALKYYFKALDAFEEVGDEEGIGMVMNNIGVMLTNQEDFEDAHDYLLKALEIKKKIDPNGVAKNYMNLGVNYDERGDQVKAMENYRMALAVAERNQDHDDMATVYNNIGSIYHGAAVYDSAIPYLRLAVQHYQIYGDEMGELWASANLGFSFLQKNAVDSARHYIFEAYEISKLYNIPSMEEMVAEKLKMYYRHIQDWEKAYQFFEVQMSLKDSLSNIQSQKEAIRLKLKYDSKVEKAALKAKQKAARAQDRQKMWFIGVAGTISIIFLLIVYNRLRITRRQKETIQRQKNEVERQSKEIEEKSHEIVDSMNSAKRLQEAMLPSEKDLLGSFKDGFLVYLPKDIVAGDFYWSHANENGSICFAVADCTGHGVPGALMSVACANALDRAVKELPNADTGEILDRTNELVVAYFEANNEEIKNGMDLAFCRWNAHTKKLQFSGAYNPLWIYNANLNSFEIIKGDRQPIGNFEMRSNFATHNVDVAENSWIYLFSDGYQDQFGGDLGKKLKSTGFRKLLGDNVDKPAELQKEHLIEYFAQWKGGHEQIDDVCVLGIKLY